MSGNALVAAESAPAWHTGMGPISSVADSAEAAGRGDWLEASVSGLVGGLDTLGAIADPFGALIAAGFGWAMEKFEPFKGWLDELCGDPGQIAAFGETWENVSQRIHQCADEFRSSAGSAAGEWDGVAIGAYRASVDLQAQMIDGFGTMTTGVAGAVHTAGGVVAGVRGMVRDAISQLVGYGISKLAQAATVVLAPKAIGELVAKVAEWAGRIGKFVRGLVKSMGKLGRLLDDLLTKIDDAAQVVQRIAKVWKDAPVNHGLSFKRVLDEGGGLVNAAPSVANIAYTGIRGGTTGAQNMNNDD